MKFTTTQLIATAMFPAIILAWLVVIELSLILRNSSIKKWRTITNQMRISKEEMLDHLDAELREGSTES